MKLTNEDRRFGRVVRQAAMAATAVAALGLSACGLRGELERPAPLWGNPPIDGADDPRLAPPKDKQAGEAAPADKPADEAAPAAPPAPNN